MDIEYQYDSPYKLKNEEGNYLRWDFIITHQDKPYFIEYDGRQHFKAVEYWGGHDALIKRQQHDKLKNDFCSDEGIELLRISYERYEQIETLISQFAREFLDWGYE
jgi:hypothetical protein